MFTLGFRVRAVSRRVIITRLLCFLIVVSVDTGCTYEDFLLSILHSFLLDDLRRDAARDLAFTPMELRLRH